MGTRRLLPKIFHENSILQFAASRLKFVVRELITTIGAICEPRISYAHQIKKFISLT